MKIFKLTSIAFSMICLSVLSGCSTTKRYYSAETIAPGRIHHYPRPTPPYPSVEVDSGRIHHTPRSTPSYPSAEVDSGRIHHHSKPFPEVDGGRMHH